MHRLAVFTALPLLAFADTAAPQTRSYVLLADSSVLEFEADATMGRFRGIATEFEGAAQLTDDDVASTTGSVRMRVAGLRTGIGRRDRHLREELRSDDFPDVRFSLLRVETAPAAAPTLHGVLEVRGVERVLAVPAEVAAAGNGFRVRGSLPIRFTDYAIDPPSRFLGLARVADELLIRFDLRFEPAP